MRKEVIVINVLDMRFAGKYKRRFCLAKCFCGEEFETTLSQVKSGERKSCGCLVNGVVNNPSYKVWKSIKERCTKSWHKSYKDYGWRGIEMCDDWLNDSRCFVKWANVNGYKKGLQIDRIDNDGNYEPSNCHFVTPRENSLNRRKSKVNTSGYTGVWKSRNNNWHSRIWVMGSQTHLGTYDTPLGAAKARDKYIIKNKLKYKLQTI